MSLRALVVAYTGDPMQTFDLRYHLIARLLHAVLGVALLNVQQDNSFLESLLYGFGSAIGFTLVLVMFAGLRERLALANVPAAFDGSPIAFIVAGLMSLAFMGFAGLTSH